MANTINLVIKATDLATREIFKIESGIAGIISRLSSLNKLGLAKPLSATVLWNKELKKVNGQYAILEETAKRLVKTSAKITFAGIGALATSAFPIAQAAAFEKSMSKVKAVLSDVTDNAFQDMIDTAQEMGETTKFTARESADAFTYLAMAGLSAAESIEALPGILQLAAAGGIDLATAADLATNVLAGMGKGVDELSKINDILAVAASKSNTSVLELGEALKIAGPAALGSGMSIERVVEALGGLANAGIKGGEGGNAIKRMLIQLQDPTKDAATTLAKLGVETRDLDGNFRGLLPIMQDLGAAQLSLSDASKIFGLYTGAAAVAAATQANSLGDLRVAIENADGAAAEMATTMQDNVAGSFTKTLSAIEGFWLAVATPLNAFAKLVLDMIASVVSFGTSIVKVFSGLSATVLGGIAAFGILATTLGSLGVALGTILLVYIKYRSIVFLVTGANWLLTKALASQRLAIVANTVGLNGLWTGLIKTKGATDALTLSSIRSAGVMGALTGAIGFLRAAALALFRIIIAHPLVALATAGLALWEVLKKQAIAYKDVQAAAKEYADEVRGLTVAYEGLKQSYIDATVAGDEGGKAAALKDIKEWAEKLAEENEVLGESALAVARAVDVETNSFKDGGTAMNNFQKALRTANFDALTGQIQGLNAELESKSVDGFADKLIYGVSGIHLAFNKQFNRIGDLIGVHFYDWNDRIDDMDAEWENTLTSMATKTKLYLSQMFELGQIDPNLSMEEFVAYIEAIPDLSEEMKQSLINAFGEIKNEAEAAGQKMSESFSGEEQKAKIEAIALNYRSMAEVAIAEYRRIAAASQEASSAESVGARNNAYQEIQDTLPAYIAAVRNVAQEEITLAKQSAAERTAAVEASENAGLVKAKDAARIKAIIANDLAVAEANARQSVTDKIAELGNENIVKSVEGYKQIEIEAKGSAAAQVETEKALQLQIQALRSESQKKWLTANKGTFEAVSTMASEANTKMIGYIQNKGEVERLTLVSFLETTKKTYDEFVSVNRKAYADALKEVEKYAKALRAVDDDIYNEANTKQDDILEIRRRGMTEKEKEVSLTKEYDRKILESQQLLKNGETERAAEAAKRAIAIGKGFTSEKAAVAAVKAAYDTLAQVRETEKSTLTSEMAAAAEKAEAFNVKLREAQRILGDLAKEASGLDIGAQSVDLSFSVPKTVREDIQTIMDDAGIDIDLSVSDETGKKVKMTIEEIMKDVVVTPGVDSADMVKSVDDFLDDSKTKAEDAKLPLSIDLTEAEKKLEAFIADAKRRFAETGISVTAGGTAVKKRFGGLIPGWGGGDKVRALLEKGEYVLRKEAVGKYGADFIASINNLSFGGAIRRQNGGPVNEIVTTPAPAAVNMPQQEESGTTQLLKFVFGDTTTDGIRVKSNDAETIIRNFERMGRLSSG